MLHLLEKERVTGSVHLLNELNLAHDKVMAWVFHRKIWQDFAKNHSRRVNLKTLLELPTQALELANRMEEALSLVPQPSSDFIRQRFGVTPHQGISSIEEIMLGSNFDHHQTIIRHIDRGLSTLREPTLLDSFKGFYKIR